MSRILKAETEINISNSRKIVDVRNRIIHGYDSVSDDVIWGIGIRNLPILQKRSRKIIKSIRPGLSTIVSQIGNICIEFRFIFSKNFIYYK